MHQLRKHVVHAHPPPLLQCNTTQLAQRQLCNPPTFPVPTVPPPNAPTDRPTAATDNHQPPQPPTRGPHHSERTAHIAPQHALHSRHAAARGHARSRRGALTHIQVRTLRAMCHNRKSHTSLTFCFLNRCRMCPLMGNPITWLQLSPSACRKSCCYVSAASSRQMVPPFVSWQPKHGIVLEPSNQLPNTHIVDVPLVLLVLIPGRIKCVHL